MNKVEELYNEEELWEMDKYELDNVPQHVLAYHGMAPVTYAKPEVDPLGYVLEWLRYISIDELMIHDFEMKEICEELADIIEERVFDDYVDWRFR